MEILLASDEVILKRFSYHKSVAAESSKPKAKPKANPKETLVEDHEIIVTTERLIETKELNQKKRRNVTSAQCLIKNISNISFNREETKAGSKAILLIIFGILFIGAGAALGVMFEMYYAAVAAPGLILIIIAVIKLLKKKININGELNVFTENNPVTPLMKIKITAENASIPDEIFPIIMDARRNRIEAVMKWAINATSNLAEPKKA